MKSMIGLVGLMLLAVGMISGAMPAVAQEGEVNLGELNYSMVNMSFTPAANQTISTKEDSIILNMTINDSLGIPSFLNTVEIGIISPGGERVSLSISDFPIKLNTIEEGNYTVIVAYGGWLPLVGGLYERITGSGEYTFTIVKEAPFDITPFLVLAGIIGAIIVVVAILRHRRKVSVLRP